MNTATISKFLHLPLDRKAFLMRLIPLLAIGISFHYVTMPVALLVGLSIPLILFMLSCIIRRAHDIGLPRLAVIFFCALNFIPALNYLAYIYLACAPSHSSYEKK